MAVLSWNSARRLSGRLLGDRVRAFRGRNYRLFWFGQLVSLSGTWMQRIAQAWLVLQLSESPVALGTVTALQFAPITLLALFGGVVADRWPKRQLMVVTQAVQMIQAATIATLAVSGLIELWHIYVLAAVLGAANALDVPCRQAMVAEMVGPEDVPNAAALNSSLFNMARIVGPGLAGGVIDAAGVTACFWLNAASYLAVIGALLAMRPAEFFEVPTPSRGRMLVQIRDGLAYALRTRDLCLIVILLAAFGTFGFNFSTVLPLLARYVLDSGPAGLGSLFSCLGIGSVAAALLIAARREATERALTLGATAFTAILFLVALSRSFPLTSALLLLLGAASTVFGATANARLQRATPAELRGRVMSIHSLLFMGTTPIGAVFIGTLSEHLGVQLTLAACAGMCLLGLLAAQLYARRRPLGVVSVPGYAQPLTRQGGTPACD